MNKVIMRLNNIYLKTVNTFYVFNSGGPGVRLDW